MRHVHIDNGQRHKNKGLQRYDQHMEHSPRPLQHPTKCSHKEVTAIHKGNEDKQHLTRIHITEQT